MGAWPTRESSWRFFARALSLATTERNAHGAMQRTRTTAERFVDHNKDFHVAPQSTHHQFASLYFSRLAELRPRVEAAVTARWGEETLTLGVKALDAEAGTRALVIGTLFKDMKNKPNILDEINRDVLEHLTVTDEEEKKADSKYCGKGDALLLEDDSGRLALKIPDGLADDDCLMTGVVVGALGQVNSSGELEVEGICLPGLPPQAAVPAAAAAGERYVALVSGLRVGADAHEMLPLQMLAEHLTGQLGDEQDHQLQANIVRLVIAGNATSSGLSGGADAPPPGGIDVTKKVDKGEQRSLAQHVRTLDQFLTAVSAAMPVDLMPGKDDPCNFLLPQQPFHRCMLPQSTELETLNLCTNPYCCDVDHVRVLGTAGQPLDDMQRYLPHDERLRTLARSLEFQHLAPTAPDTLGCYPFDEAAADPFVVRQCPHIYFAGNQPKFESSLVEGPAGQRVRVVMVPDFATERTAVLVNLSTLEAQPISFAGMDMSLMDTA